MSTTLIEFHKSRSGENCLLPGWHIPAKASGAFADCSLILATYKRPDEVISLVKALAQRSDVPAEIVIADGCPEMNLGQRLASWMTGDVAPFDLVYVRCPAGLTRQRNIGIDLSTRQYVFFLDDDALPLDNYFREIRRTFSDDSERKIGAVGGSVINELDRPISGRWKLRLALGIVPKVQPMTYAPCGTSTPKGLLRRFSGVRQVDVLPGCAFAFRREVLEQHRFSSFFDGYSQGEDLEMSLRVARDWTVVCCGDAEVLHHPATAGRPPSFAKGRMEVRNRFFIWKRHRPATRAIDRLRFWLDIALLIIFDILHWLRRPWRGSHLSHAAGLLRGACQCVFAPPCFPEPPAHKEYSLATER
jgi:GT2 family glycosyltransferase